MVLHPHARSAMEPETGKMSNELLAFVNPGAHHLRGHEIGLPHRTHSGLAELASSWPGDMALLSRPSSAAPQDGIEWRSVDELPYDVVPLGVLEDTIRRIGPSLLMALHRPDAGAVVATGTPTVLYSEFTLPIRLGQIRATIASGFGRSRAVLGQVKVERSMRALARSVRGLQCNGASAFHHYGRLNERPLHYNDHRLVEADLERARSKPGRALAQPLTLAFSGRVTAVKGSRDLKDLAHLLQREHPEVRLHVFGTGDQLAELKAMDSRTVVSHGFLPFDPDWKTAVLREIDVMVLPHPQGDPSCTYFEALGLGAPVLGYRNTTWGPFVESHGSGWAVPTGDVAALSKTIGRLKQDRTEIARASAQGIEYMRSRSFEATTLARAEHLASCL